MDISKKMLTFALRYLTQRSMIILNIETSTDACSAAITENGVVLNLNGEPMSRLQESGSEHARQLPMMVDELLQQLRQAGRKVDAVAVSEGPGSYTGLRIGASAAKGLAYGMNVPLVAVPTLQIMAAKAVAVEAIKDGLLCPMIDARRMEVYNSFYTPQLVALQEAVATVVDADSFAEQLAGGPVCFFGNGAAKCRELLACEHARFVEGIVPDAAYMGALAEQLLADHQTADVAYWTPFYLKEFEAKKSVVKGLEGCSKNSFSKGNELKASR